MKIETSKSIAEKGYESDKEWVSIKEFKDHIIALECYATAGENESHSNIDLLDKIAEHTGKILEELSETD